MTRQRQAILCAGLFFYTAVLSAQDAPVTPPKAQAAAPAAAASDADALAKATQNPVASLISVPLQNNSNFGVGDFNRTQNVFNIQPVVPKKLNENWMLITRVIQPIVWQPYVTQNAGGQVGFGDMNPTFFFSPAKPSKLIFYSNAVHPPGASSWGMRLQIALLFPQKPKG